MEYKHNTEQQFTNSTQDYEKNIWLLPDFISHLNVRLWNRFIVHCLIINYHFPTDHVMFYGFKAGPKYSKEQE